MYIWVGHVFGPDTSSGYWKAGSGYPASSMEDTKYTAIFSRILSQYYFGLKFNFQNSLILFKDLHLMFSKEKILVFIQERQVKVLGINQEKPNHSLKISVFFSQFWIILTRVMIADLDLVGDQFPSSCFSKLSTLVWKPP